MSKVILICGKICSGKSYYAKQLTERYNAVIFSIDEATFDLLGNEQGDFYDAFVQRVKRYLMKKAAETAKAGATVILDWGFWTKAERKEATEYFNRANIEVEWHYINVEQSRWLKLIEERNARIKSGIGGSDFYVDGGLLDKLMSKFEEPTKDETVVWHENN